MMNCLKVSGCFSIALAFTFFSLAIGCGFCIMGAADTNSDLRLVVYAASNSTGEYSQIPPEFAIPKNTSIALRSPELGFIVVETGTNDTEYVTNELLNQPWVDTIEQDAGRKAGSVTQNTQTTNASPVQETFTRIGLDRTGLSATNRSSCSVAVIATGADGKHQDFADMIRPGYDWIGQDSIPEDTDGQGTALCGIISTIAGNFTGLSGAPAISLIPEKIGESGANLTGSLSALAIAHAADSGADIILMGYGGTDPSLAEERAVAYASAKGCLLIAPAGDEDANSVHYPSDDFGVISVGSIAQSDGLSYFSNYGIYIELVAPGEDIITSYPGNGYCMVTGTDVAAAEVAGTAALVRCAFPGLTSGEIRKVLRESATDLGRTGRDIYYGYGRTDASKALKKAQELSLQKTLRSYSEYSKAGITRRSLVSENLTQHSLLLQPGWNFITVPSPLRSGKTCSELFAGVNTDSHTIWTYRGYDSGWLSVPPDATLTPLEGVLVYSDKTVSLPLILDTTQAAGYPVVKGWNLVGSPSYENKPAKTLLDESNTTWVSIIPFNATQQQYDPSLINGAGGRYSDLRIIDPFTSFWIYMDSNGSITRMPG